jgi:hypothetical protein
MCSACQVGATVPLLLYLCSNISRRSMGYVFLGRLEGFWVDRYGGSTPIGTLISGCANTGISCRRSKLGGAPGSLSCGPSSGGSNTTSI